MALKKITEKDVSEYPKGGASVLVTQQEDVDGVPTESVRRVPATRMRLLSDARDGTVYAAELTITEDGYPALSLTALSD